MPRTQVINTHLDLRSAARHFLTVAENPEGRYYSCMGANLFSFLSIEGFLNALGSELLGGEKWMAVERESPMEKLDRIGEFLGYEIDYQMRPFESFHKLKRLRDRLAHARIEQISRNEQIRFDHEGHLRFMESEIDRECNIKKATQYFKDTKEMFEILEGEARKRRPDLPDLLVASRYEHGSATGEVRGRRFNTPDAEG